MLTSSMPEHPARERLTVRGQVQGVGFRPFVYRLAHSLHLSGWVSNQAGGVVIEIQGSLAQRQTFHNALQERLPPLARIRSLHTQTLPWVDETGFRIVASADGGLRDSILPDMAPCPACRAELFDPANRRYHYPFINCIDCGPRYSITRRQPYDRAQTSMRAFRQCARCESEYNDPHDRRFHAQPNACPECGPRLWLAHPGDPEGRLGSSQTPITEVAKAVAAGKIVAVRGVGGFHCICDATQTATVARLRQRKRRPGKPLAIMVTDLDVARRLAHINETEALQLQSPQRPIVLLERLPASAPGETMMPGNGLDEIAPGLDEIGLMLPSAPVYYLLLAAAKQLTGADPVWVVTSANASGDPLWADNTDALSHIGELADLFLLHDRDILAPTDDSLLRVTPDGVGMLRRARGYAPAAITLPAKAPPVLAVGGGLKNTFCITRDDQAYVSVHLGDLASRASCLGFDRAVDHLLEGLAITPRLIVRDLHPDFYSSQAAEALARHLDCACVTVQHHYAHLASVMAEHGLTGPVLGLALDGMGLGDDGHYWGGELMRIENTRWRRLGHFAPLPLPGGDRAAREPWRMAAAVLHRLQRSHEIAVRFATQPQAPALQQLLDAGMPLPLTSSAGRWFDAAAGLLGVSTHCRYEGEAAMQLEALACQYAGRADALEEGYIVGADGVLDMSPLLSALADEPDPARGAARFHATLVEALAVWCLRAAEQQQLSTIVIGGGCFQNRLLRQGVQRRLHMAGLRVYGARQVPCGDGGLSLGQAWHGVQLGQIVQTGEQ